jgi:hypothetical protein
MLHIRDNIKLIRSLSRRKQEDFILLFPGVTVAMQKSYESGKAKPDTGYIDRLARMAGISVEDVKDRKLSGSDISVRVEKVERQDFEARYYEVLERERKALEDDKAFFKEMLRTSLGSILMKTEEMWARQKGTGEIVLGALERLEGSEEGSLVDKADKRILEIDREAHERGNIAAQGK